jgi:CheY-like chemotaxis protein
VQKGSTFTIRLPLAIDSPRSIPAGVAPDPSPNAKKPGLRLLVVDDNRDAAESLAILLRATGNEVDIAFDGPSALVMMCRKHPDAVFLDLGLPIMDGYEVARRIRAQKQFSDLVIVALSGWGNEKDRRRSRAAGIDHHLIKPAEFEEIQALLMSASTRRRVARD